MQEKLFKFSDLTVDEVIEKFPLPFFIIRGDKIIHCNQKALKVFGYIKKEELLGLFPYVLSPDSQPDGTSSAVKGTKMIEKAKESGYHRFRWIHKRKNGKEFLSKVELFVQKDLIFATVNDIDHMERLKKEKEKLFKKLKKLAIRDYLTGLYNKRHFVEQLDRLMQSSNKETDRFSLLFIDIDSFKEINDTLGHHVGDRVIAEAARRLKKTVPKKSLLARYGGDEFIAIVYDINEEKKLYAIAKQILKKLYMFLKIDGYGFYLSASIGIARYPLDGEDADTLIKNADIAMYKAKERREEEHNIKFFSLEMEKEIKERFLLESHLRKALEKNELSLFFQPIVNIRENRTEAAEALIRWENESLGYIPPDKFIPLAEETGLIHEIGEFVLNRVCQFIQNCRKKGAVPLPVAVNISVKQLENRNFAQRVKNIIAFWGIAGESLEFEITESVSAGNMEIIAENLQKIKRLGIKIAVDDFGTGYSSLALLLNLEIDKIKIDKIFINKIGNNRDDKIIRTVISMAKELGLNVVAEGIETEEQIKFLKNLNCEYGQGYFWAKPYKIADFEEYLSQKTIMCPRC